MARSKPPQKASANKPKQQPEKPVAQQSDAPVSDFAALVRQLGGDDDDLKLLAGVDSDDEDEEVVGPSGGVQSEVRTCFRSAEGGQRGSSPALLGKLVSSPPDPSLVTLSSNRILTRHAVSLSSRLRSPRSSPPS